MPDQLPVFRLGDPVVTHDRVVNHIAPLLGLKGATVEYPLGANTSVITLRAGTLRLDADFSIGRLWFVDQSRLWNHRSVPSQSALPSVKDCAARAEHWLRRLDLLPPSHPLGLWEVRHQWTSSTRIASCEGANYLKRRAESGSKLDMYSNFGLMVRVRHPLSGSLQLLPVIGFGARAGVTFGETEGTEQDEPPIGLSCSWRPVVEEGESHDVEFMGGGPFLREPRLAYSVAERGDRLVAAPRWVYSEWPSNDEVTPPFLTRSAISGDVPEPWFPTPLAPAKGRVLAGWWRCWLTPKVGLSASPDPGLSQTAAALQRFIDAIPSPWSLTLRTPDTDTVPEWIGSAARVEEVDMIFYCGHASARGWYLDERNLVNVGKAARFGHRLSWLVIAACGPLQDIVTSGKKVNVFDWLQVFSGLRMLLGYANQMGQRPDQGAFFLGYACLGLPLRDAWFRAARDMQMYFPDDHDQIDTQPVFAAALYPQFAEGAQPELDHLWGFGDVTPKPSGVPEAAIAVYVPI